MQRKEYWVKLFPPGKKIIHDGNIYTVENVRIRNADLFIKFLESTTEVNSEEISCEYTVLVLK